MKRNWKLGFVAAIAAGALSLAGCGQANSNGSSGGNGDHNQSSGALSGKVYFLLPDQTTIRFEKFDKPAFITAMKKQAPHVQVVVLNAGNSVQTQVNQVQTAVTAGAKAIVLVPVDPNQSAGMLSTSQAAQIPVICFAHACNGGSAYAYLTVPFVEIGKAQGAAAAKDIEARYAKTHQPVRLAEMFGDPSFPFYTDQVTGFREELDPLINSGKVKVVCKADALQWLPSNAQTNMDQCLTKTQNGVDGILTMNDDLGGGALAAVSAAGLKHIPLYGGYDATLSGVQRVLTGEQLLDMTADYTKMDSYAATLAIAAAQGKPIPASVGATKKFNNESKAGITEIDAPNAQITAQNVAETVIKTGLYTRAQVCTGAAATSAFCR